MRDTGSHQRVFMRDTGSHQRVFAIWSSLLDLMRAMLQKEAVRSVSVFHCDVLPRVHICIQLVMPNISAKRCLAIRKVVAALNTLLNMFVVFPNFLPTQTVKLQLSYGFSTMNVSKSGYRVFSANSTAACIELAKKITERLGVELGKSVVYQESNGETRVDVKESVRGQDIFIIQTIPRDVNTAIMELLVMAYALKTSCAKNIIGVIPYFPYSKQCKMRKRGSIVCKLLASMLAKAGLTHIITMDLHQKEIQGFFSCPVDNLRASPFLIQYIQEEISKSYILLEICTELGPGLERQTARSHALPVPIQVLTTLGFLATGSFQRELADRSGMSQGALSRAIVLNGIIRISARYIRFPYDAVNQAHIKAQFAEIAGFPNVIGAIDCTHIAIKAPSEGEYAYVNRKHFHSLNVQIICDAQMRLTNIVARWPGSTHDSFVLTNSSVGNRLEPGIVERAIGQLKSRWRCLDRSGGLLLYHPEKVSRIVQACGVLHNIAHRHGVPLREIPDYRNAVIVAKSPSAAKRAQSYAERLRLGLAVIHGEAHGSEADMADGRQSPPAMRTTTGHTGLELPLMMAKEKPPITVVGDVGGRIAIIVDDIIDNVEDFVAAAELLKERGAYKIYIMATHGLLSAEAPTRIEESAIDEVVVTNTVPHELQKLQCPKIKTVDVSMILAEAIRRIHNGESMAYLFRNIAVDD
ncbi:Phosphoribosyl pyrophosphate synthase-associated protein 1 [Merluccius polli]|uniref:Phosphoribosyl pyrophosphate synthase-associated protein 1 n=1 Tax=Merluccius polli TaxID=89951 RepID=A0AA47NY81_MERPO|nr:Phosphoribosyl pyrophosphate synthase-associated protein 1 [Merluccius polli]